MKLLEFMYKAWIHFAYACGLAIIFMVVLFISGISFGISSGISMCPSHGVYGLDVMKRVTANTSIISGDILFYPDIAKTGYYLVEPGEFYYIGHRYINETEGYYMLKGDNNEDYEYVDPRMIKYKEIYHIPFVKCNESDIRVR